jgi:hypothetical protein
MHPSHPTSRVVTIAIRPFFMRWVAGEDAGDLPDEASGIFFPRHLDRGDHLASAGKISFSAQVCRSPRRSLFRR